MPQSPEADWAVALFNRSVLKQAKYHRILDLLQDPAGKTSLDLGADNGVISYLLRQRGGRWYSADLDSAAVTSIRQLVGDHVYQLDGRTTPFSDRTFDQVVIVDFLEHIPDDRGFIAELARIMKPGGRLIVNVPHLKPHSLLNRIRHRIGLTDEWHGHLRPGYSQAGLRRLLEPHFVIERASTYSRAFSELVDTGVNGVYETWRRRKQGRVVSQKGTLVTRSEMERHKKQFILFSALYPFLWTMARLDVLLPFQAGYKLIVRARRAEEQHRVTYTSAYAEHYHKEGASGQSYDRSLANRFELAIFQLEHVLLLDLLRRLRSSDPNTRYLDFACGTGRILAVFKALIRSKVGVDTSPGQLALAREKVPDAELLCGNLVTHPELLAGRQFDLITSFRLLLNLEPENRVPILRALRDHLAPGGYLVVDNHMNRYSILGLLALLAHKVLRVPKKPLVPAGRRGIISTMSEGEMRRTLAAAGLQVHEVHRIFVLPGHKSLLLLPTRWLVPLEAFLRRVPLVNRLSKNQIYVCSATQPTRP